MRFWPRLFGDRKAAALTDVWAALVDGGGSSKAGLAVTPQAALQATVVLACVRVLAEGIAQLPFCLYRSNGRGAERRASIRFTPSSAVARTSGRPRSNGARR